MHIWWRDTERLTQAKALDWCNTQTKLKCSFTWSGSRDPAASLINPNHRRRGQTVDKLSHLCPTKRLWSKGLDALIWQLRHYCSLTRTPRSVKRKQQVASRLLPVSAHKKTARCSTSTCSTQLLLLCVKPYGVNFGLPVGHTGFGCGEWVWDGGGWIGSSWKLRAQEPQRIAENAPHVREQKRRKKKSRCWTNSDLPVETSARR